MSHTVMKFPLLLKSSSLHGVKNNDNAMLSKNVCHFEQNAHFFTKVSALVPKITPQTCVKFRKN